MMSPATASREGGSEINKQRLFWGGKGVDKSDLQGNRSEVVIYY